MRSFSPVLQSPNEIIVQTDSCVHQTKVFEESWERSDAEAIVGEKDYFVADIIDILRVRSRKLNCPCATGETEENN